MFVCNNKFGVSASSLSVEFILIYYSDVERGNAARLFLSQVGGDNTRDFIYDGALRVSDLEFQVKMLGLFFTHCTWSGVMLRC